METPVSAVSPPRKCLVLILDGLGDLPAAEPQGRTPLEAAETPIFTVLPVWVCTAWSTR